MEYLVPLAAVAVIGVLTVLVTRWLGRRPSGTAPSTSGLPLEVGEERAREAAGLLDEAAHRAVYGHIAQGRVMEAIRAYRGHTGRSLRDAVTDVQSLAAHPQVWRPALDPEFEDLAAGRSAEGDGEQARDDRGLTDSTRPAPSGASAEEDRPGADETGPRSRGSHMASAPEADSAPLVIPAEWSAEPAPEVPPFDVEVMRADGAVRVSSRDLPPWLRDQLAAMLRDGNLESAAVQLSTHSKLTVPESFELLRRLREEREGL